MNGGLKQQVPKQTTKLIGSPYYIYTLLYLETSFLLFNVLRRQSTTTPHQDSTVRVNIVEKLGGVLGLFVEKLTV
jgi:hypothetical protein